MGKIRRAFREDVSDVVRLLADDPLGAKRERFKTPLPQRYYDAFEAIDRDDNHELVVMEDNGELIGTLQLTILPYLTYEGGTRGLIEAVRIAAGLRGGGLGAQLIEWAIGRCRERGCRVVQLTTDKTRAGAVEFYQKLGFKATHEGLKLHFEGSQ